MTDVRVSRTRDEGVNQSSGMVNDRAEAIDSEQTETMYEQVQVETVQAERGVEPTVTELVEQREGAAHERIAADEEFWTVEQGGGAVNVQSSGTGSAESEEVTRTVERVRIRWGSNNSKKYDGKVEDVPAQWVVDESLVVGHIVTVNVWGGRTWAGTVMKLFYQQNPLDMALPIKRTRHQSPFCSQPSPSPPAEKDNADKEPNHPRKEGKKRKGNERAESDIEFYGEERPCKKLKHSSTKEKAGRGKGGRRGKESGRLLKLHEKGSEKGQPTTDTGSAPEPPSKAPPRKANEWSEDRTLDALTSIQKGQVLLLENLQQMTEAITKGFEKLGSFTSPTPQPSILSAAPPSQLHVPSHTMTSTGPSQAPSTAPPPIVLTEPEPPAPAPSALITLNASIPPAPMSYSAPPLPASMAPTAPTPPAPMATTEPPPPPMAPSQIGLISPPLATSTPIPTCHQLPPHILPRVDIFSQLQSLLRLPSCHNHKMLQVLIPLPLHNMPTNFSLGWDTNHHNIPDLPTIYYSIQTSIA